MTIYQIENFLDNKETKCTYEIQLKSQTQPKKSHNSLKNKISTNNIPRHISNIT